MGSESPLRLPTIDFSNVDLKPGTIVWNSVKLQVKEALEEFGCFEAVYNQVPAELHKALFSSLEELFDLPLQTKLQNRSSKPFHGYVGQYPMIPLYESMGIEDAPTLEIAENFTNMMWPEGNANFCKTVYSYSKQVAELDQVVRRMVLESLGVEKYYDEHVESTTYLLRVMKYKGPQTNETKLGLNSHTDKNIAWTNGRLHSPHHRVMMTGNEARYSTGLFSFPKAGYIVKAPEELVDEDHPLLFKPFDHVEFFSFYYTEEGQMCKSALKTYCGV
ncbi:hypothetical protein IFM89_010509 [Coptis chinensis]|uniref:Non-haem dioxygenase N-terminal domain-containing protein n=1 Tax=Coptis chinensis TaxID=261450 RepID=A0A835HUC3_9MAGN|nr:hypothetical protein IFM89_010509 [Coptis chinensis]